jgi:ribosomal protein L10
VPTNKIFDYFEKTFCPMTTKKITILNTKNFFQKYPIVLVIQHNNLSVKEWNHLRVGLKKTEKIGIYSLKNSIAANFIDFQNYNYNGQLIFQGPCAVIGCLHVSALRSILDQLKLTPKIILIGAVYNKHILTHLDINKMYHLDYSVYISVLQILKNSTNLSITFNNFLNFEILQYTTQRFLNLINLMQFIKKQ